MAAVAVGLGLPLVSFLGGLDRQPRSTPAAAGAAMAVTYAVLIAVSGANVAAFAIALVAAGGAAVVPYAAALGVARHPLAVVLVGVLILGTIYVGLFGAGVAVQAVRGEFD